MVLPDIIRKGSKVYFADTRQEPVTVLDNNNGEISVNLKTIIKTVPEELYPVPLDETTIIRSGFFKTDAFVFEHPVDKIELEIDHTGVTQMHVHDHKVTVSISSLHELQHAYWRYTNKELEFN